MCGGLRSGYLVAFKPLIGAISLLHPPQTILDLGHACGDGKIEKGRSSLVFLYSVNG